VRLQEADLEGLEVLTRGDLAFHIRSVTFSSANMINVLSLNESSESSDVSTDSWYSFNGTDRSIKFTFRQLILDFLLGGRCGDILGSAMSTVSNLKRVAITEPVPRSGLKPRKLKEVQPRWTITVKTVISAVLATAAPLEILLVGDSCHNLAVHTSVLEHLSIYRTPLKALRQLRRNIALVDKQGRFLARCTSTRSNSCCRY
jgi:hypothetical protein